MQKLIGNLSRHVHKLAGDIGERHMWREGSLERAAEYVEAQLRANGYSPWRQAFTAYKKPVANVIADKEGDPRLGMIVIGAHYDTVPGSPGADDNASAVAGMLELARLFSGIQTKRPMAFAAFVNEESPCFGSANMGSLVYARSLKAREAAVELMASLEMIGYFGADAPQEYPLPGMGLIYPRYGDFIAVTGNFASAGHVLRLGRGIRKGSAINARRLVAPERIGGINRSDNQSFWEMGYRAVMVTDTANFRNKNYHQETDTPDTLDYEAMAEVVKGLYGALAAI
jgi:Zn-dependent M28 family amino/carboxypeptidase